VSPLAMKGGKNKKIPILEYVTETSNDQSTPIYFIEISLEVAHHSIH
jgi:hypothetical protein